MQQPTKKSGLTVLVVDDDPDFRSYLRQCMGRLQDQVEHVLEAPDGDEALRLVRRVSVDLVIVDLVMPGLDGAAFCTAVKADPQLAPISVLLITGDGHTRLEERLEIGADAILFKPFNSQSLIEQIRELGLMGGAQG